MPQNCAPIHTYTSQCTVITVGIGDAGEVEEDLGRYLADKLTPRAPADFGASGAAYT